MLKFFAVLAFAGFLAQGAAALATDTADHISARGAAINAAAK